MASMLMRQPRSVEPPGGEDGHDHGQPEQVADGEAESAWITQKSCRFPSRNLATCAAWLRITPVHAGGILFDRRCQPSLFKTELTCQIRNRAISTELLVSNADTCPARNGGEQRHHQQHLSQAELWSFHGGSPRGG